MTTYMLLIALAALGLYAWYQTSRASNLEIMLEMAEDKADIAMEAWDELHDAVLKDVEESKHAKSCIKNK